MALRYHVLTGPTAAGKTALLLRAAAGGRLLVISADSRQVYRHMDVGTGKASSGEQAALPHRVIDVVDPGQEFSAFHFLKLAADALREARESGLTPWICGGTGLYIRALAERLAFGAAPRKHLRRALAGRLKDIGPRALARQLSLKLSEPGNPVRVLRAVEAACAESQDRCSHIYKELSLDDASLLDDEQSAAAQQLPEAAAAELARWDCAAIHVLDPGKSALEQAIRDRVAGMFSGGLAEEVQRLRSLGFGEAGVVRDGIAYREAAAVLDGGLQPAEAVERAVIRTRQYAKRQRTYFRGQGWAAAEPAMIEELVRQSVAGPG